MVDNIELHNKTGFYDRHKGGKIFSNVSVILFILLIAFAFMGYIAYNYFFSSVEDVIKPNSSYFGQNILLYEPLFEQSANTVNDCVDLCKNDVICDGITYNNDTQICIGTKNGTLRNDQQTYSAWIKPINKTEKINKDFTKAILVGYTKVPRVIAGLKLANPYILGNFAFSFNIIIYDFYKNYGYWRHIFHKGTEITTGTILNYQSWENLVRDIPNQSIGVWLAPFTNNLRIAINTTSIANMAKGNYQHAFQEKCNDNEECYITDMPNGKWVDKSVVSDGSIHKTAISNYLEYFDHDIQNIPINTQLNIVINFRDTYAEIYFNGKIVKITQLDGTPQFDKSNLYILNEKTVNCELTNILYSPDVLNLTDISNIITISTDN